MVNDWVLIQTFVLSDSDLVPFLISALIQACCPRHVQFLGQPHEKSELFICDWVFCLSFPWEKLGVMSLSLIMWCWARDGNSGKWEPHISYQLWCGWFCACLGVLSIWTGNRISHKGSWFVSCWFVLAWGKPRLASCSAIFLTSPTHSG